jgi:hypothetical protein
MHPEMNIAIARAQIAERLHDAEHIRRLSVTRSRLQSDLRTRVGRALVSLGTRPAPPQPEPARAGRPTGAATLIIHP